MEFVILESTGALITNIFRVPIYYIHGSTVKKFIQQWEITL